MVDDDSAGMFFMFWPRGLFETRRHARRRFEECQARFAMQYEVTTLPGGEEVATLRPEWRASKNGEDSPDQQR